MSAKSTFRTAKTKASVKETEDAPAPAPAPKPAANVIFESAGQETHEIVIAGIRSRRIANQMLRFTVPAEMVERFSNHAHCTSGRVVRRG